MAKLRVTSSRSFCLGLLVEQRLGGFNFFLRFLFPLFFVGGNNLSFSLFFYNCQLVHFSVLFLCLFPLFFIYFMFYRQFTSQENF